MKMFASIVGVGILMGASHAAALTDIYRECETEDVGGLCQVALGDIPGGADRLVIVDLTAQCFPRVVNLRVSGSLYLSSAAPRGVYIAPAGVSTTAPDPHESSAGTVSFYVKNAAAKTAEHVYLGFMWECEGGPR